MEGVDTMSEHVLPRIAIVKYNNGNGALLCNYCHAIIAYGFDHEDKVYACEVCKDVGNEILNKPI